MDTSDLKEIKGIKYKGWTTYFYIDDSGECVAKHCSKCRVILLSSEFYPDSTKRYQLGSTCKLCTKISSSKRYKSVVGESTLGRVEALARRTKLSSRTHKEVLRDQQAARPTGTKQCRTCKLTRPLIHFYTDKTMKDGLTTSCSGCHKDAVYIRRTQSRLKYWEKLHIPIECYVCGGPYEHADHVVPLALHGPDDIRNLLPMCGTHNVSKSGTPLTVWLRYKFDEGYETNVLRRLDKYGVTYT